MDNNADNSISNSLANQVIKVFSAVEASSEGIFVTDIKGRVEYANQNFLAISGWSEDEILGRSISEIPHSKNIALKLLESLNKGTSWSMRHQVSSTLKARERGKPKLTWVRTTVDPIEELSGEISGYIGVQRIIHDEVERELQAKKELSNILGLAIKQERTLETLNKSYEEALLQVATKSEFLANMSHEIRTPLNGVLGMAELLQETSLNNKQSHLTEIIHQSGKNLLNLINDILDLSKIEANKLELKNSPNDLRLIVEEVASTFSERACNKGLELTCIYPANDHSLFICDRQRLTQILSNLLNNAIKFTDVGEVVIEVKFEELKGKPTVIIEVRDTGIGISKEDQEAIFGSFSQSLQTPEQAAQGTGLGLTICRHLADLMGGEIGVKSKRGEGATFWLAISFEKDSEQSLQTQTSSKEEPLKGLKVLIVDDNESSSKNIAHQLKEWNIEPNMVEDFSAALILLEKAKQEGKPFSIAMLDHDMQEFSGINLSVTVKKNKALADIPLILMNSIRDLEDTMVWTTAGVKSYLTKPVRQSDLYNALIATVSIPNRKKELESSKTTRVESFNAHVLIAEDNPVNQELVKMLLTKHGCTYSIARNGEEAIDLIETQTDKPFDLILMDCQMPIMDGYEATKRIRAIIEPEVSIPIVAITANSMEGDQDKCIASGMDDYLTKPFSQKQLAVTLQKWLPNKISTPRKESLSSTVGSFEPEANEVNVTKGTDTVQLDETETDISELLNRNTIDNIRSLQREGSPDILGKIVGLYLDNSNKIMQEIEQSVSDKDGKSLRSSAHSLKSSSANLGADRLADMCKAMELCGKDNQLSSVDIQFKQLKKQYEVTCNALKLEIR